MNMRASRRTVLLVDASGELASRLEGSMTHRQLVKCGRDGEELLLVIRSLRFDAIVLYHPAPGPLESYLLPAISRLADPPRLMVIADQGECTAISARYGVMCLPEPTDGDAIAAAIDLVCERDLRVDRP